MIVRTLSRADFVARFGGIFEHSPWVAEGAFDRGLTPETDTPEGLHAAMVAIMRAADREKLLALINAHPDLAGKLQAAGLDMLTDAERARFTELNDAYKARFAFPFIMAVKGRNKAEILAAFEYRLNNDPDQEFKTALAEIEKISLLRLRDLAG
jgi:OHCU decarboxylase